MLLRQQAWDNRKTDGLVIAVVIQFFLLFFKMSFAPHHKGNLHEKELSRLKTGSKGLCRQSVSVSIIWRADHSVAPSRLPVGWLQVESPWCSP